MSRPLPKIVLMFALPFVLVAVAAYYYLTHSNSVSTDNAYIQQDKVSISVEVSGLIVEVAVRENQRVERGDLLLRVDPEPYQLAVADAQAALAAARTRIAELEADYQSALVDIDSATEDISYYEKEYRRQLELLKTKVTTDAALQAAQHALTQAQSNLAAARADASKAKAALSTGGLDTDTHPAIRAAQVQLEKAELNLSRTTVRAPVSGIVSQTGRLQVGQMMMQALPALTIVNTDTSWVEANFKETDLEKMHVGQRVIIEIDTYPGLKLQGHVESFGAGTGSEFLLLPAQNANANWVKVTQRVPVRIALDDTANRPLIAGLSVHVRVDLKS